MSESERESECAGMLFLFVHSLAFCVIPLFFYSFTKKMWYLSVPPFLESLRLVKLGFKSGITGARGLQLCFPWIQHQCVPGFLSQMKSTTHFKLGEPRKLMMAVLQHPATGITHTPVLQKQTRLHVPTRCFCISYRHLLYGGIPLPQASHTHTCATETSQIAGSDQMLLHILPAPAAISTFSPIGSLSSDGLRMGGCVCLCIALAQYGIN